MKKLFVLLAIFGAAVLAFMVVADLKFWEPKEVVPEVAVKTSVLELKHVTWTEAQTLAKEQKKPIIVCFTATWCGPCQILKEAVLHDETVIKELNDNFIFVLSDVDKNAKLADEMEVEYVPTVYKIKNGDRDQYKGGVRKPKDFLKWLKEKDGHKT